MAGQLQARAARLLVATHTALYRRTGGRIGARFGRRTLLLLTTTGRRSGTPRTLPLQYVKDGPCYVVAASNWGRSRPPAWYLNLRAAPRATIQVGQRMIPVTAEQAGPEEKRRLWPAFVARDPTFARYQQRTTRDIPLLILRPDEQRGG
jgi:deazaflavin-dependent oxidoreductase (nitroreductase family)